MTYNKGAKIELFERELILEIRGSKSKARSNISRNTPDTSLLGGGRLDTSPKNTPNWWWKHVQVLWMSHRLGVLAYIFYFPLLSQSRDLRWLLFGPGWWRWGLDYVVCSELPVAEILSDVKTSNWHQVTEDKTCDSFKWIELRAKMNEPYSQTGIVPWGSVSHKRRWTASPKGANILLGRWDQHGNHGHEP